MLFIVQFFPHLQFQWKHFCTDNSQKQSLQLQWMFADAWTQVHWRHDFLKASWRRKQNLLSLYGLIRVSIIGCVKMLWNLIRALCCPLFPHLQIHWKCLTQTTPKRWKRKISSSKLRIPVKFSLRPVICRGPTKQQRTFWNYMALGQRTSHTGETSEREVSYLYCCSQQYLLQMLNGVKPVAINKLYFFDLRSVLYATMSG